MKLTCAIQVYKIVFRIQGHTKDFWYIMSYACKRLEMYFDCVPCFIIIIIIILNFKALCDAYTV